MFTLKKTGLAAVILAILATSALGAEDNTTIMQKQADWTKNPTAAGVPGAQPDVIVGQPEVRSGDWRRLILNTGPIALAARQTSKDGVNKVQITLSNCGATAASCTVDWQSPAWWSHAGKPFRMEQKKFDLAAGQMVASEWDIAYDNWNPHNRYPVTCLLTTPGGTVTGTMEIGSDLARESRLGEPRSSDQIKDNKFGVLLNFGRPVDWSVLSGLGVKWVRTFIGANYADGTWVSKLEDASWFKDYRDEDFSPVSLPDCMEYLKEFREHGIRLNQNLLLPRSDKEEDRQKYRAYCRRMSSELAKYGQKWFEFGNEPSDKWGNVFGGEWNAKPPSPWVPKLCAMARAGAQGLKEGNPEAVVCTGGGVLPATYRMLEEGLGPNMDAISDHPYAGLPEHVPFGTEGINQRDGVKTAPDDHSIYGAMRMLHDKCVASGYKNMEIWLSEWGFSTFKTDGVSPQTQAKYTARRMIEFAAVPEVTMSIQYQLIDDGTNPADRESNFGITYFGGYAPKPAYYIAQRICSLFSDGVKPWPSELKVDVPIDLKVVERFYKTPNTPRCYAFAGQNGELMLAVWLPLFAEDPEQSAFCDIRVSVTGYQHPIAIDLMTGERKDLEMATDGGATVLKHVWVADYPIVIKLFAGR